MLSVKYFINVSTLQCENILNLFFSLTTLFSSVRVVFKLFGIYPLYLQASGTMTLLTTHIQKSTPKMHIYKLKGQHLFHVLKEYRRGGYAEKENDSKVGRGNADVNTFQMPSRQKKNFNTRTKMGSALSISYYIIWPLS